MKNKRASLLEMVKLVYNPTLSEPYIRYLCGLRGERDYHHHEIQGIAAFLQALPLRPGEADGFIFGYEVPRLNKEFDLLKITESICVDLELKSYDIEEDKIQKQLEQNGHYLNMLAQKNLYLFTFLSSSNRLYRLTGDGRLRSADLSEVKAVLEKAALEKINEEDLDLIFEPGHILISPLYNTQRFLEGDYLLTEQQKCHKRDILEHITSGREGRFIGLTGDPGTGKTLLLYDIAKELSEFCQVLVIHGDKLCEGHRILNGSLPNLSILSSEDFANRSLSGGVRKRADVVVVDEAQRLSAELLGKLRRWVTDHRKICILGYDSKQVLSYTEQVRRNSGRIGRLCGKQVYTLSGRIRINSEMFHFIECLFDLKKYKAGDRFPNIRMIFEPDREKLRETVEGLIEEGYTFVALEQLGTDWEPDTPYISESGTVREFDRVCMILNDDFRYSKNEQLESNTEADSMNAYTMLLYQGLTRARNGIALIVESEGILRRLLPLMRDS